MGHSRRHKIRACRNGGWLEIKITKQLDDLYDKVDDLCLNFYLEK